MLKLLAARIELKLIDPLKMARIQVLGHQLIGISIGNSMFAIESLDTAIAQVTQRHHADLGAAWQVDFAKSRLEMIGDCEDDLVGQRADTGQN